MCTPRGQSSEGGPSSCNCSTGAAAAVAEAMVSNRSATQQCRVVLQQRLPGAAVCPVLGAAWHTCMPVHVIVVRPCWATCVRLAFQTAICGSRLCCGAATVRWVTHVYTAVRHNGVRVHGG